MKKIFLAILLLAGFQFAHAQEDTVALYKKFPVPVFNIMTVPDSIKFSKADINPKLPTVIMIFSPDCSHCQIVTKDLIDHIDLFKKAQIVMVSSFDFSNIKKFYGDYKIASYPNIIMGRDGAYMLGTYYKVHHYPSIFVYDRKGNFVKEFDGTFKMEDIAAAL